MSFHKTDIDLETPITFDKNENNMIEFLLNIDFRDLQRVSNLMNFDPILAEESLKNVQIIRDFLLMNEEILKENESLKTKLRLIEKPNVLERSIQVDFEEPKDCVKEFELMTKDCVKMNQEELKTLLESQINEKSEFCERIKVLEALNEDQLIQLGNKNSEVQSLEDELSCTEHQLKSLKIQLNEKEVEEMYLMQNLRNLTDQFGKIYRSIDDYESNYQSEIEKLTKQIDYQVTKAASTQGELNYYKDLSESQLEELTKQSLEFQNFSLELSKTNEQLIKAKEKLNEKTEHEKFLVKNLDQLSDNLDKIHLLVTEKEEMYQTKINNFEDKVNKLTYQLKSEKDKLLSALENLNILGEIESQLSKKQDLIDLYEEKIKTLEENMKKIDFEETQTLNSGITQSSLATNVVSSDEKARISQLEEELKRKAEPGPNANILESLAFHYEELKIRYREKRYQMDKLKLENLRIENELKALKNFCLSKGWVQ